MITVYNVRGTNGSGKSTLARSLIAGDPSLPPNRPGVAGSTNMVDLADYPAPTKADHGRRRWVEGYASPRLEPGLDVLVVGGYRTACGGLDAVPDFETSFAAIRRACSIAKLNGAERHRAVVAEGVLASTVWGSWGRFADDMSRQRDVRVAFCYLDTPLEVCLERIRRRQEAAGRVREIKADLVADKVRAVAATRRKAIDAGHVVYDLPHGNAEEVLRGIMVDGPGVLQPIREQYRAR